MITLTRTHLIILGLVLMLTSGLLLGSIFGRDLSPENLSPEFKQLKSHLESQGLKVEGGEVRPKSQLVRARARFTLETATGKREFSLERCVSDEAATKRVAEILQIEAVSSQLATRGPWVLRLEDEWNAEDEDARELRRVFLLAPTE